MSRTGPGLITSDSPSESAAAIPTATTGITLLSYALGGLPPAGTAGRLARVTDDVRGPHIDNGSAWIHLLHRVMDLRRDFGATGDWTTDETTAFTNAIAELDGATGLFLPPGTYRITSTLTFNDLSSIAVFGAGAGKTVILWDGGATGPALALHDIRDSFFRGFRIQVQSGTTLDVAMRVRNVTGGSTVSTNNTFEDVFIHPGSGSLTDGVHIGVAGDPNANNDFHKFRNVRLGDIGQDGFVIRNSQSKQQLFEDVQIGGLSTGRYGVYQVNGSFHWLRGSIPGFGGASSSTFRLDNADENVTIDGLVALDGTINKLLETGAGSASYPILIKNTIWEKTTAGAGNAITFDFAGPLVLLNNQLRSGVGDLAVNAGALSPHLVAIGNSIVRSGDRQFWTGTWGNVTALANLVGTTAAPVTADEAIQSILYAAAASARPATGAWRLANAESILGRNAANSDNITIMELTSGDDVQVGEGADLTNIIAGSVIVLQVDQDATAGNTRALIYDVTAGALRRISIGAVDSGGAGFRVLRIPN